MDRLCVRSHAINWQYKIHRWNNTTRFTSYRKEKERELSELMIIACRLQQTMQLPGATTPTKSMKPRYMVITLQLQYVMQTKPAKQLGLTLYDRLGLNHYVISVSNQRSNSWYSDTEKTWRKFHLTRKIPQSLNRANSDIRWTSFVEINYSLQSWHPRVSSALTLKKSRRHYKGSVKTMWLKSFQTLTVDFI